MSELRFDTLVGAPASVHRARMWMAIVGGAGVIGLAVVVPTPWLAAAAVADLVVISHAWISIRRPPPALSLSVVVDATAFGVAMAAVAIPPVFALGPLVYLLLATAVWVDDRRRWAVSLYVVMVSVGAPLTRTILTESPWTRELLVAVEVLGVLASVPLVILMSQHVHTALRRYSVALQSLAERDRFNAALVDGAPYGIAVTDEHGAITATNRVFDALFGAADGVGSHLEHRLPGLAHALPVGGAQQVTGVPVDGRPFPAEIVQSAFGEGDDASRVYFIRDISARLANRRTIDEQAALLDQIHSSIIATDTAGSITSWNRRAEEMFGWSSEEVLGRRLRDVLVFDSDVDDADHAMERLRSEGRWTGEFQVRRRNGSMMPLLVTNAAVTDDEGLVTGYVGVSTDITERRAAEEVAVASRRLAARALDSIRSPVVVLNSLGATVAANRAWRSLAGSPGMSDAILPGMASENAVEVSRAIAEVAAGFTESLRLEAIAVRTGDGTRFFDVEVVDVMSNVMVSFVDVSAAVVAARALGETVASQSQIIAEVSHEVRGPISNLLGLTELLSSGALAGGEASKAHDMISEQARDLVHLFDDLLVVARAQGGQLQVRSEVVDLVTETRSLMAAGGVADRVDLVLAGDPVLVLGDRTRIRQVVRNLVSNAERYGGPQIVIDTATLPGWVCLFVRDNGDGIPESDVARVFEPYGRVAGSDQRHEHSVGLGLHVARELARRMGGDLGYARHDGWTVFEFRLPAG